MASPPQFRLTSTQTALAFVLPSHLHTEIDSLRRLYDKSFRKWDPHINILYPFVDPSCLLDVISKLGSFLSQRRSFSGNINDVGVFHHRRNATVFKKPNSDFGDELCRLRGELAAALGCPETEGTHDGIYRPHMTIGQAGLAGDSVEKLVDLVGKLVALRVNVKSLTVLQRDAFGNMKVVEELPLRSNDQLNSAEEEDKDQPSDAISSIWRPCHAFSKDTNWEQSLGTQLEVAEGKKQKQITISTYNIMAEPLAAPFTERLPYIKNAISSIIKESAPFKVLCLQEVSDESLSQLLSDPLIQDSFPFSSHSSTSLLPNHRNLVTLASARFVQFTLQFTELHKSSLVVYFPSEGIEVANVHLSAGLADQAVASKGSQMETLTEFLHESQKEYNTEVILAGDFNLTTSSRTIQTALATGVISPATADALPNIIDETIWDDCFIIYKDASDYDENIFPGEEGATYDRLTNPFAMGFKSPLGRSVDDSPQRYDRVLFRKSERLHPKTIERFGLPDERGKCGSDHYGVCASIQIRGSEEVPTSVEKLEETASIEFPNIERVDDGTDLLPLLEPHLPTDSDRQQREDAIQLLRDVFIDHEILGGLLFAFLGSYLLDTYSPASDIDLLVIGQASQQAFFDFAESRLRAGATHNISTGHEIRELRVVKSLVPVMKVVIAGIKFDLQYCRAQELWERYHSLTSIHILSHSDLDATILARLSPSALRPLNAFRDSAYVLRTMPDTNAFQIAYRYLALYLKRRGIYSAKFGYLGGIHLSLMLNRVIKLLLGTASTPNNQTENKSAILAATLVRSFLVYYSFFNWKVDVVIDPVLSTRSPRSYREPVFIQAIHLPAARPNVAASCTRLSAQTLTSEFRLATEKIAGGDWCWCIRPIDITVREFFASFGAYVRIALDLWDVDEIGGDKVREMIGCLESRITRLMVGLGKLDGVSGRAWPGRFRSSNEENLQEDQTQYKGYYLIGLSAKDENDVDRKKILSGKVLAVVRDFQRSVEVLKEFQNGSVWLEMDTIPKNQLLEMDLILDNRNWSNDVSKQPSDVEDVDLGQEENTPESTPSLLHHPGSTNKSGSTSLRPSQDIIARIKWDPQLQMNDFLIGYEDRFVGVKEMDLGNWKSEQTDEEFIPMHRIVWVRRKGEEGEKVWDRRSRVDHIFGSGTGSRSR